jgi:uncharacterized protein YutD
MKKYYFVLLLVLVIVCNGWTQERQLKRYTTYQTSLTNEDIMNSFVNEVRTYLQRYDNYGCYYLVSFEIYQDKDDQNVAWTTSTVENKYQWGTVYTIRLWISNAVLWVKFCNTSFTSGSQDAAEIVTTRAGTVGGNKIRKNIVDTAASMFSESQMVLKMFNRNYSDELKEVFALSAIRILF